jgi:hypothetical protein
MKAGTPKLIIMRTQSTYIQEHTAIGTESTLTAPCVDVPHSLHVHPPFALHRPLRSSSMWGSRSYFRVRRRQRRCRVQNSTGARGEERGRRQDDRRRVWKMWASGQCWTPACQTSKQQAAGTGELRWRAGGTCWALVVIGLSSRLVRRVMSWI